MDIGWVYYLIAMLLAAVLWRLLQEKKAAERTALTILLPYLFLVIIATLVSRQVRTERHLIHTPFWTIHSIVTGGRQKAWLIKEVIMNVLMLAPVGLLSPILFSRRKVAYTLGLGLAISISIELLQWLTRRGYAELDDIVFNLAGILIGFGMYRLVKSVRKAARR